MIHLGDVRKINGAEIEPVDIIAGGFPCTQMSSAGSKEGLQGKHSSLFYEMVRIVQEMREATNGKYPRYTIIENVRGALNRHKGSDFYTIIKESCKTAGIEFSAIRPKTWKDAGCVLGSGYSFAWRVFNSQYWSVPQIRRRVYAVGYYGQYLRGGGITHIQLLQQYSLSQKVAAFALRSAKKKGRIFPLPVARVLQRIVS